MLGSPDNGAKRADFGLVAPEESRPFEVDKGIPALEPMKRDI
jgi:hypothetical protein